MNDDATTQNDNPTDHANAGGGQTAETGESGGFKAITSETELAAWKSETRKAIVAEVKKAVKADADAAAEAERQQRERDEEVKRGEFDKVRGDLEQAAADAKTEAAGLKAENDQLRAAIAAVVDADWTALPDDLKDLYMGADDNPLERLAYLAKAKPQAAKRTADQTGRRGNGPDPRPAGAAKPNDDDAKRGAAAIIRGAF